MMMLYLQTALIFAAAFFVVLALYGILTGSRGKITSRLKQLDKLSESIDISEIAVALEEPEKKEELPVLAEKKEAGRKNRLVDRYNQRLGERLKRAYLYYRPREFFLLSLGLAVLTMVVVLTAFFGKFSIFAVALLAVAGGGFGFMIPGIYLSFRESKYKNLLSKQVADMLMLLANYLRAGHSFTRSIELVSREIPAPLGDELATFVRDVNMGGTTADALKDLEARTRDEDLTLVLTAIQIHHQIGGNLAEILDSINHTIRERIRLKGEIRTLTAQGRLTAIVISLLPVVVALIIAFLHPSFIMILFTEPVGLAMLAVAVVAELAGIMMIRRIVQIEV